VIKGYNRPNIAVKTYAISRYLAKFLLLPKSPNEPILPKLRGRFEFLLQIIMSAILNEELQNSKMGINVFKPSCRDFFGHFKT
jgi:hypothetical protein